MGRHESKVIIRRLVEEFNKGNVLWGTFAPECVFHNDSPTPWKYDLKYDLAEFKEFIGGTLRAFPDYHLGLEDLIIEDGKVVAVYTESGTMKGRFLDWGPTNKKFTQPTVYIYRITEGKIVEAWMYRNHLSILRQLGVEPTLPVI